jgi:hypothetical protein
MASDVFKDKWESVQDLDFARRKPDEWARIYFIKLVGTIPNVLWNEYEWAYHLPTLKYYPMPDRDKNGGLLDSYDKSAVKEMRATELRRDIFMGADMGEPPRRMLQRPSR